MEKTRPGRMDGMEKKRHRLMKRNQKRKERIFTSIVKRKMSPASGTYNGFTAEMSD